MVIMFSSSFIVFPIHPLRGVSICFIQVIYQFFHTLERRPIHQSKGGTVIRSAALQHISYFHSVPWSLHFSNPLAFNVLHLQSSQYIFLAFSTLLPLLSKPGGGSRSVNCYIFVHQFSTRFLFFNVVFADFPARHWSFHRFRSLTLSWFSLYFLKHF